MDINRQPLDGEHMDLYRSRVPPDADAEKIIREFSILCGAASACAVPLNDELDLGRDLDPRERWEWTCYVHLLLRISDYHTFGAEGTRAEVIEAAESLAAALRENGDEEQAE
jgi:hypothetical protein